MASGDAFLEGLNYLSPASSLETSPANGTSDPARRSQYDLSAPVDAGQVAAQLDAWTNVAFDFESFVGATPPSFDRAFDQRASMSLDDVNAFASGSVEMDGIAVSTVVPTSLLTSGPANGLAQIPSMDLEVSSIDSPAHTQFKASKRNGHTNDHTTGVGTALPALTQDQMDEEANRRAYEEDKRRRNTAASARFRVKKKQREQALEQNAKELRDKVVNLEKEVDSLKSENGWLRNLVLERGGPVAKAVEERDAAAAESTGKRSRAKTSA